MRLLLQTWFCCTILNSVVIVDKESATLWRMAFPILCQEYFYCVNENLLTTILQTFVYIESHTISCIWAKLLLFDNKQTCPYSYLNLIVPNSYDSFAGIAKSIPTYFPISNKWL